jgi:hypothetical protein
MNNIEIRSVGGGLVEVWGGGLFLARARGKGAAIEAAVGSLRIKIADLWVNPSEKMSHQKKASFSAGWAKLAKELEAMR